MRTTKKELVKKCLLTMLVTLSVLAFRPELYSSSKVYAEPVSLNIADGSITISAVGYDQNGITTDYTGDYIITGSSIANNIVVTGGTHNITLSGVNINVSSIGAPSYPTAFDISAAASVNLTLMNQNTLRSGNYRPGLSVPSGANLTITASSSGELTANGGFLAAGIGGVWGGSSGYITINGGTVNATGSYGAGIGGGEDGSGGTTTINGGVVNATGTGGGAGIGSGDKSDRILSGGTVIINGGTINATATGSIINTGKGIGADNSTPSVTIIINGGSVRASSMGVTPKNIAEQNVYKTTVSLLGKEANALTSGLAIRSGEETYSFGDNDIMADNQGKLYLYLPQSSVDTNITLTANSTGYSYILNAANSGNDNAVPIRTAPYADSIAITTPADKLTYKVGDSLDITGMVVTGTYSGDYQQSIPVTLANVSGFNSSTHTDSQTLTVTLEGQTTTYTIVIVPALSSIAITTPASKLTYRIGESLDITGIVITGTYTDGSNQIISVTTANVSGFNTNYAGTRTLTVRVDNKTATYQITIIAPYIYVTGNNVNIPNGDTYPSVSDHTDFTSIDIMQGTVVRTFTIRNYGSAPLTLNGTPKVSVQGENAEDFTVTAQPAETVAVSGYTTFKVTFDPSTSGTKTATISIANDDSFANPFSFSIKGIGTAVTEIAVEGNGLNIADGDVTPSSSDHTDFGSSDILNGTVTRTFTIKNNGSAALTLDGTPKVAVEGANAEDFTVTEEPSETVEVAGSTTFKITFDPGTIGLKTANIRIVNNDNDENPYNFSIQGTGTVSPEIEVEGNYLSIANGDTSPLDVDHTDFGSADIISSEIVRTFTIKNTGSAVLTLSGTPKIVIAGTNAADFAVTVQPSGTVEVSESTTFQVKFDPSTIGLKTVSISISNNDTDENPYIFTIQGTGTVSPEISIEGNGLNVVDEDSTPAATDHTDFGSTDIIHGTVTRTFTIRNTGSAALTLSGTPKVLIEGADTEDFTVTAQPADTVAIAGSATFTVTFNPNTVGVKTASIRIDNDDSDENPYNFIIQGTGTAQPEISAEGNGLSIADGDVTPSSSDHTDFGSSDILNGTVTRTFTIKNNGSAALTLDGTPKVAVEGANADDFTVTEEPSETVEVAGSTTFKITFDPGTIGLKTANIRIVNNDNDENPYNFAIQGTGTAEPEISVEGNGISIAADDSTPATADHTDFGSIDIRSGAIIRTFTIKNTGSTALTLDGTPRVVVEGADSANFIVSIEPSDNIEVSGSSVFEVTFDPSSFGLKTAIIRIANNDNDENPFNFTIQGTGTIPEINVIGNGMSIADGDTTSDAADHTYFGSIDVENGIIERTFTVENTGNGELTLSGTPKISISGVNASDFGVTTEPDNSIASGGDTTFIMRFDPSGGGIRNAVVSIENNDSDENIYTFSIKGIGTVQSDSEATLPVSNNLFTPVQITEMLNTGQTIQIDSGQLSISINPEVIPHNEGQTIFIETSVVNDVNTLSNFFIAYPEHRGVMKAFSITMTGQINGQAEPITQLNGEITLGFSLTAEEIDGIDPSTLIICKQGEDGSITELGGVYNWATGTLSVSTAHLCKFFIMGQESIPAERLCGENRYATAVAISQKGWSTSDSVILTSSENYPDALVGTVLASVKNAPILLTASEKLNKETLTEINRLKPKQIFILGGTSVISPEIEDELIKNHSVTRIFGKDRYETAVKLGRIILQESGSNTAETVILATGSNYPDALAIAPYAGSHKLPILFTDSLTLNQEVQNILKEWKTQKVILAGGIGAISLHVELTLKEQLGLDVIRLNGADRYLTSLAIVKYFNTYQTDPSNSQPAHVEQISLATGADFPDALAGAAFAAKEKMPLLLVSKDYVSLPIKEYLKSINLKKIYLFGGEGAIGNGVKDSICIK